MAKTQVTLPTLAWSATLEVCNQDHYPPQQFYSPPTRGVGFATSLGGVQILNTVGPNQEIAFRGPPLEHDPDGPILPGGQKWVGRYFPFLVLPEAISSGWGEQKYAVWGGDMLGSAWVEYNIPPDFYVVPNGNLSIQAEVIVEGVRGHRSINVTPRHTNELSFHERTVEDSWHLEPDGQIIIRAIGPAGTIEINLPREFYGDIQVPLDSKVGFSINHYYEPGIVYARISNWAEPQGAVDLTNLNLYSPGADPPDPWHPDWGRTATADNRARIGNDGGIATWWEGDIGYGASNFRAWRGDASPKSKITFKPVTGKFADDVEYNDIEVYSPSGITWVWDTEQGKYVKQIVPFVGERTFVNQPKSWEFEWEWRQIDSGNVAVYETTEWREDARENVDGTNPILNDQQCALLVHALSSSTKSEDPREEWAIAGQISYVESHVIQPEDITERPANWTGSGGLTPDVSNNDLWTIASGSIRPSAKIELASRKMNRLSRFVAQNPEDESSEKLRDLIYINKANIDKIGDAYIDPEDERIPENPSHWENASYAWLLIKAPHPAVLTIKVQYYGDPIINDPGYPTLYPGEASVEWGEMQTATWKVQVNQTAPGEEYSSVAFDLMVPQEGSVRPDLYLVKSIEIQFPPVEETEQWEFVDFIIGCDHWDNSWGTKPPVSIFCSEYDPYDFEHDYTGFRAMASGRPCFHIPFGYEEYESLEKNLKQRQKSRSRNEELDIFDYAKSLGHLFWLINVQENWTATYYTPETKDSNQDEDGVRLFGEFKWYDLINCHEWGWAADSSADLGMAPVAGQWSPAPGVETVIYYMKYPQGRPHGLVYLSNRDSIVYTNDKSARWRYGDGKEIYLYQREVDETEWNEIQHHEPDQHGIIRLGPDKEKDYVYKVDTGNDVEENVFSLKNRLYTWITTSARAIVAGECGIIEHLKNFVSVLYSMGEGIFHIYTAPPNQYFATGENQANYPQPKQDTSNAGDCSPSGYVDSHRNMHLFFVRDSAIMHGISSNWGKSWTTMATNIEGSKAFVINHNNGIQSAFVVNDSVLVHYLSNDHFATTIRYKVIDSAVDDVMPSGYVSGGKLYCFCMKDETLVCWMSEDCGKTWAEQ